MLDLGDTKVGEGQPVYMISEIGINKGGLTPSSVCVILYLKKEDNIMTRRDGDIIGERLCKCGCGKMVQIKRWTLHPSKTKTEYIKGHQQFGNKRGWKGGEVRQNGYVFVYSPNHPNRNAMGKGYVKRARLVVENRLGRYLEKHEQVHHLNGIRDDDRLENLVTITHARHMSIHHKNKTVKFHPVHIDMKVDFDGTGTIEIVDDREGGGAIC